MNAMQASAMPTDMLEMRAADQRRRIHASVIELRTRLEDKLDIRKRAAEYVGPASGVAVLLGLIVGWGFAGMFSSPNM